MVEYCSVCYTELAKCEDQIFQCKSQPDACVCNTCLLSWIERSFSLNSQSEDGFKISCPITLEEEAGVFKPCSENFNIEWFYRRISELKGKNRDSFASFNQKIDELSLKYYLIHA